MNAKCSILIAGALVWLTAGFHTSDEVSRFLNTLTPACAASARVVAHDLTPDDPKWSEHLQWTCYDAKGKFVGNHHAMGTASGYGCMSDSYNDQSRYTWFDVFYCAPKEQP